MTDLEVVADATLQRRIRCLASSLAKTGYAIGQDDLIQEANLALFRCASAFDASRGTFWTFSRARVRGAMVDYIRRFRGQQQSGDVQRQRFMVPIESVSEQRLSVQPVESEYWLAKHLSALPARERDVIRGYYFDDMTLDAIGQRLGMTAHGRASQLRSRAVALLRARLTDSTEHAA